MTRQTLAFVLAATASGAAWADKPVHATATVEVLDDKAQIDDVISRMQKTQPPNKSDAKTNDGAQKSSLRDDRPPAPLGPSDAHRAVTPENKSQLPGSRRPLRDNHNFERAERPRPKKK